MSKDIGRMAANSYPEAEEISKQAIYGVVLQVHHPLRYKAISWLNADAEQTSGSANAAST